MATLQPFPDYELATSFDGSEPDDFQPRAEMKRMFQNYIVPQKFVKGYVDHVQGGMMSPRKSVVQSAC